MFYQMADMRGGGGGGGGGGEGDRLFHIVDNEKATKWKRCFTYIQYRHANGASKCVTTIRIEVNGFPQHTGNLCRVRSAKSLFLIQC